MKHLHHYRLHDDEFVFNRKNGSNEDDIFNGTNGRDVYFARGGNDNMTGGWGNDRLDGGPGNDGVYGGGGNDHLTGGSGNDYLAGEAGKDIISGGSGADTFGYNAFGRFLFGGSGIDRITDFDPKGRDHDLLIMQIVPEFNVHDFSALKAGMQMRNGNTIMDFGNGDILILEGVNKNQLSADDFLIFG